MPWNAEPLSAWPPDDDWEGLEDALEGRPHVARRRGGDEFGGGQSRDRVVDRQLIDPAIGGIAQKQSVSLHHLSGLVVVVGATALLPAGCVGMRRGSLRVGLLVSLRRQTLVFLEISQDPSDRRFGGLEAYTLQEDHNLVGPSRCGDRQGCCHLSQVY